MRPLADLRRLWAIRTPRRMGLRRFLAIRTHRYRACARRVHRISTCVYFLLQPSLIYLIYWSSDSFQLHSPPSVVACSKLSFSLFEFVCTGSPGKRAERDYTYCSIDILSAIPTTCDLACIFIMGVRLYSVGSTTIFLLPVVHVLFFSYQLNLTAVLPQFASIQHSILITVLHVYFSWLYSCILSTQVQQPYSWSPQSCSCQASPRSCGAQECSCIFCIPNDQRIVGGMRRSSRVSKPSRRSLEAKENEQDFSRSST